MPRINIPKEKKEVSEKLHGLKQRGEAALPWFHDVDEKGEPIRLRSVSFKQFTEYALRKKLHLEREKEYEKKKGLPKKETVDAIWELLGPWRRLENLGLSADSTVPEVASNSVM